MNSALVPLTESTVDITNDRPKQPIFNTMEDFGNAVRTMCELQDELKEMTKEKKGQMDRMKSIKEDVLEFMIQKKVRKCNYNNDEELVVNKRVVKGSVTKAILEQAIYEFFGEDQTDMAKECHEFILSKTTEKEVVELKRQKRRPEKAAAAAKTKKKKTAPSSASVVSMDDGEGSVISNR